MQQRASVSRLVRAVATVVALAAALGASVALAAKTRALSPAAPSPAPDDRAGRLVYLLEYIGSDYQHAVRDGQVVDQEEYGEVLRLLKEPARD